jgi:penicillin amidase
MKKKLWIFLLSITILFSLIPIVSAHGNNKFRGRKGIIIIRDNYGVPHIFSKTKEGLAFGAGYAMAEDRLWQADLFRRQAFGSLAELGLASIESDYNTRRFGYSKEELREIFDNWVPTDPSARAKEMLLAYVDGLNFYISEALEAALHGDLSLIPIEYFQFEIFPPPIQPFTIEDCVAIIVMMAWRFGGTGGNELDYWSAFEILKLMYGEAEGWLIFNDIFPQQDPGAEVTIPSTGCQYPKCNTIEQPVSPPIDIITINENYNEIMMGQDQLFESLGLPTKFGSNAWVVHPKKSETKNALQLGGPQMGHSIPQIVVEIGLHGAGIDAVGMTMPAIGPFILIGANRDGAWTSTTGGSDVMDIYFEELNPADPTQYLYNGEYVDMEVRTETFNSPDGSEDRYIYRTIHGPLLYVDEISNLGFSIKTPYFKNELAGEEGWLLFQQARNIKDFQKAVKTIQASHNFLWADRHGDIGYWHAGTFPIKPEIGKFGQPIDDRFPLWGTGEEEWVGVTGFDEMPKCINPNQGWLANWNNKPIANWPYGESDAGWGEGHRVKQIQYLLGVDDKISFEDMNRINMDAGYNHIPGMNFLHYLIEAASGSSDPDIQAALPFLEAWNHHYNDVSVPRWPDLAATYDDPGLTIFDRWFEKIDNEVFDDDLPPDMAFDSSLIHVFDGEDSKLPLYGNYLNGEDRNEVINRVLNESIQELRSEMGSDMLKWLTPMRTTKFNPLGFLNQPPLMDELRMHSMNRGTYNHIVEMKRKNCWNRFWKPAPHGMNVIPPGQKGFVNLVDEFPNISPHSYDQLILYETWRYKPMRFYFWDIWSVQESVKLLFY